MKRGLVILGLGLAAGLAAFVCVYWTASATHRSWLRGSQPELAWLKYEFRLSEAEFQRVSDLHAGYLPRCRERCASIDLLNRRLAAALSGASEVTPEIEQLLSERARLRALCQTEMLQHFFAVSRAMPPQQGRRYLAWVQANTCLNEPSMTHHATSQGRPAAASSHR